MHFGGYITNKALELTTIIKEYNTSRPWIMRVPHYLGRIVLRELHSDFVHPSGPIGA